MIIVIIIVVVIIIIVIVIIIIIINNSSVNLCAWMRCFVFICYILCLMVCL